MDLKDLSSYDVEISKIKNGMDDINGEIEEATNAVLLFNKTIQEQNKVVDDLNQKVKENNATVVSAKMLEFEVLITILSHVNNQSWISNLSNFLRLVFLPGRSLWSRSK